MQKVRIKKTGKIVTVDNNIAHTLIDSGVADLVRLDGSTISISKGLEKPEKDKMISPKTRTKIRKK